MGEIFMDVEEWHQEHREASALLRPDRKAHV